MSFTVTFKCEGDDAEIEDGWTVTSIDYKTGGETTRHACDKHVAELIVHLMFVDCVYSVYVIKRLYQPR